MGYRWPLMGDTVTWADRWAMIRFIATADRFTNGKKVKEFEAAWDAWLGSRHSLFVTSGSAANLLLVSATKELHGLRDGDKVLVPTCTWATNITPLLQCNLRPIFCDINLSDYSFDPKHMEEIRTSHPDIRMIFATHLLGFSSDLERCRELFPDAIILEDICEAHGCLGPDGMKRGANSIGATFSFYFGHHMTTIEGGMVSTCDEELHDLMRIKRSHGMARELPKHKFEAAISANPNVDPRFMFLTDGYNFRNDEISAVLGLSQLKRLDTNIWMRRRNYRWFLEMLRSKEEHFHLPTDAAGGSNFAFPLLPRDRKVADVMRNELEMNGIESRPVVSGNLLLQPFLSNIQPEKGSYRNINIVHENGVYVGNNHLIDNREIELLSDVIDAAVRRAWTS